MCIGLNASHQSKDVNIATRGSQETLHSSRECQEVSDSQEQCSQLVLQCAGMSVDFQTLLPSGEEPLSGHLKKYWSQRYRLFSRYDEGIVMDHGKQS